MKQPWLWSIIVANLIGLIVLVFVYPSAMVSPGKRRAYSMASACPRPLDAPVSTTFIDAPWEIMRAACGQPPLRTRSTSVSTILSAAAFEPVIDGEVMNLPATASVGTPSIL